MRMSGKSTNDIPWNLQPTYPKYEDYRDYVRPYPTATAPPDPMLQQRMREFMAEAGKAGEYKRALVSLMRQILATVPEILLARDTPLLNAYNEAMRVVTDSPIEPQQASTSGVFSSTKVGI